MTEIGNASPNNLPIPQINVQISPDMQHAFVKLSQTPPEPYQITAELIQNALINAGFPHGHLLEEIDTIIREQTYPEDALVAKLPQPDIKINTSSDKMQAFLSIEQDPPVPYQVTIDALYDALAQAQIEYGVDMDKLDSLIENQAYPTDTLIAQGKPAQPGTDGQIEYLFKRGQGGKAKDEGYRVDHYALNLVENVSAGQTLVVKIPEQPGQPGMTVQGRELKAPRVKKVNLPKGKGTKISEDNPLELVAAVDGFVRLDKKAFNQVVVEQQYQVSGNVDLSTGNLDIDGSVKIGKSVKEGFKVVATGDIIVNGSVEGCTLEAGGNIEVKGGIIGGRQRAVARTQENISVKFADNADIIAGGIISIADEAVNCKLEADDAVIVGERGKSIGSIIGGEVLAGSEIRTVCAGTASGTLTRLRVGESPSLINRRRAMQTDIKTQETELEQLAARTQSLQKKQEERAAGVAQRAVDLPPLKQQQAEYYRQMKLILARAEEAGYISSADTTQAIEAEIKSATVTLNKIKTELVTLINPDNPADTSALSLEQAQRLNQLKQAYQALTAKLNTLETNLTQQKENPWAKLPWAWRKEMAKIQEALKHLNAQITHFEAEIDFDQKLKATIVQSNTTHQTSQEELIAKKEELASLQAKIESLAQKSPRIIVTGTLWAGTEIRAKQVSEHIKQSVKAVQIQITKDTPPQILTFGLNQ